MIFLSCLALDGFSGTTNYIQAPLTPRSPSEQKLFNQVKAEVASRLRQSLHNAILINLDKESQPEQVVRIWDAEVKIGARSPEPLPTDTTILQVFDRPDIAGRLLILGTPVSGKTTTQLELAKALLERCEHNLNSSTPVLFNLSSWQDERQSMKAWLVAELKSKYGVRQDIATKWLSQMRLLPLLDGLDELPSQRQEPCIHTLNQFVTGESAPLQVVVCTRLEEYEQLGVPLRLNGAICLRELTDSQIQAYLASTHQPQLWSLVRQDTNLLTLLRAPLLLSMTVLTYQQGLLHQWQTSQTSQERLQLLLGTFIQSQLVEARRPASSKNKKGYTRQQTHRWLTWLAQQLERESQTEFLIERLQPCCLPNQKLLVTYHCLAKLIGGLISGLSFGLIYGLGGGLSGGLIGGLGFEPSSELENITVAESLTWSWTKAAEGLIVGLIVGLFGGLFAGLGGGLSGGLIGGLFVGLSRSEVEQKSFPNQGIWKTLQTSLIYGLIVGLIVGLIGLSDGLSFGLIVGLIVGLRGGLSNCIKHITLRIVLCSRGYSPWNYAQFLNHYTDRLLLQRVGGRYRFMHKLLQEHFAAMSLKQP